MMAFFRDFFVFRLTGNETRLQGKTVQSIAVGPDFSYTLAVMDFDDQGISFDHRQVVELENCLHGLKGTRPVIVAFVHGWKHDASPDDPNLTMFKSILAKLVRTAGSRPVLGVFLGWRGSSRIGNWLWVQSSFWSRERCAGRVASGTAREVLGMLKAFRNGVPAAPEPQATFVVVGHSFGGLIVYTALAQSLIEAASTQDTLVPSFGDLVVLLNPAFRATAYLPIWEIVKNRGFDPDQPPVFVAVTAANDRATKIAFRYGTAFRLLFEWCRGPEQRQALINTIGHLPWLCTHRLTAAPLPTAPATGGQSDAAAIIEAGSGIAQVGPVLVKSLPTTPNSPFWVASAAKEVVNGHNDFSQNFVEFVSHLLIGHTAVTGRTAAQMSRPAAVPGG